MNQTAFKEQVISLSAKLLRYIQGSLRVDAAEDVLQDIFLKLWKNRSALEKIENIQAYCFKVTRNHCFNILAKRVPDFEAIEAHFQLTNADDNLIYNETEQQILSSIKKLPPKQAEIIYLKGFVGLQNTEIAEITNHSVENIRMIISRARKQIKKDLKKAGIYE